MAVTVERVHLAMAHAALPGLLPTPPEWKTMVPLLPTPPPYAAIILPKQSPGRADAVDRWDAGKNDDVLNKSPPNNKPGRADAAERWDARKIAAQSSLGQMSSPEAKKKSSSSSASSCARWDSNKKKKTATPSSSSSSSSSISSSPASRAVSRWESSKRPVISRGSSRWDAHKKPRPPQENDVDDGESSTGSNEYMELHDAKPQPKMMTGLYAAPGFLAAPEPSMLPTPSFQLVLPRFVAA